MRSRDERTSPAMWPLTWLSIAIAIAAAAYLAARGTEATRNTCHLAAYADRLDSTRLGVAYRPPSCTAADTQYDVWVYVALVSAAVTLVALGWFLYRAHTAAASGNPWPTRRATSAVARWLNSHLPGEPFGPGSLTATSLALLAAILVAGGFIWSSYRSSQSHTNYEHTYGELAAARSLPSGLTRVGCTRGLCASATLTPSQAAPLVTKFLRTTVEPGISCTSRCGVYIGGEYDGFPALAHLVATANGTMIVIKPVEPSLYE
jgi:hypothetical protein